MSANDIQSETIVSAEIVSDPAGLCAPGDPTAGNIDPTNPDERTAMKGHGKSSATNSPGNHGSHSN
jgi:hypothetical protein